MFKIDVDDALVNLVELCLERGNQDRALIVPIKIEHDDKLVAFVDFMFYRPTAYTKVGMTITRKWRSPLSAYNRVEWSLTSDHDSAWRSDGIRSPLHELFLELAQKLAPGVPPVNVPFRTTIGRPQFVEVERVVLFPNEEKLLVTHKLD